MAAFKNILFPTDFSPNADHACKYAIAFARHAGGTLHVCTVVDTTHIPYAAVGGAFVTGDVMENTIRMMRENASERLERAKETVSAAGVPVKSHLADGPPHEEILRIAEKTDADLVVLGTHGRSGFEHLVFGSTCDKVVRLSPAPVLAVKHPENDFVNGEAITLRRILCPCDFSDFSKEALPLARNLCREFGATLVLGHVVDTRLDYPEFMPGMDQRNSPALKQTAQEMLEGLADDNGGDINTECRVMVGIPHNELVATVWDDQIDLIVMATHGRTGMGHVFLGSTAEKVARMAPCPVLTMRPGQRKKREKEGEKKATFKPAVTLV